MIPVSQPWAVVTCGPAYAPLDAVRRITNNSTGELGKELSEVLRREGWEVVCYRGTGATAPAPQGVELVPFGTNASLENALRLMHHRQAVRIVFHAAALCDFEPATVSQGKWDSRTAPPLIALQTAPKLLPQLKKIFPQALIVAWKYEVEGGRRRAISRAREQIEQGLAHASVANGPACGSDFYFVRLGLRALRLESKQALCDFLASWASRNALPTQHTAH